MLSLQIKDNFQLYQQDTGNILKKDATSREMRNEYCNKIVTKK